MVENTSDPTIITVMEDLYPIQFASLLTHNQESITFVFTHNVDLGKVVDSIESSSLYSKVAHIYRASSLKFIRVRLKNYTWEDAYRFRLTLEEHLFNDISAIRVSIGNIRATWPSTKNAEEKQNQTQFQHLVTRPTFYPTEKSPQDKAWDELVEMARQAKAGIDVG